MAYCEVRDRSIPYGNGKYIIDFEDIKKDDKGFYCEHCSYDTREYQCTLADFMEMINDSRW